MVQKLNSSTVDLIIIVIILITGLKFTLGLENTLDIDLADESAYLADGVALWNTEPPHPSGTPLYIVWYFMISLLEPNRISLYYLNYKLMTILLPILTYGVLRKNTVSIPVSLIISWLLLVSPANALTLPRVSHFALLLILATFLFIGHKRSLLWSSLFASMGALLVSYVRPEYFLTYVLSTLLFIFLFIRDYKKLEKQYLLGLMAYGICSFLVLGAVGLPIAGERSMIAFGQHFSLNWIYWNKSNLSPWTNWREIISHNFGPIPSIPEALAKNPSAFLMHITYNLLNFVRFTPQLFFPVNLNEIYAIVVALVSIGLLIAYLSNSHFKRLLILISSVRKNLQEYKRLLILVALFLLPTLASIIIIYPRDHYLLIFSVLIVVITATLLINPGSKQGQINLKKLSLLSVLIILVTPGLSHRGDHKQQNLRTIQFVQSLEIDGPINLLATTGGYSAYLGNSFHRVKVNEKNADFAQFRIERSINMIVMSDDLRNDTRFKNDPEWQRFLENYRQFGYLQMEIPNTHRTMIVQADLLHK